MYLSRKFIQTDAYFPVNDENFSYKLDFIECYISIFSTKMIFWTINYESACSFADVAISYNNSIVNESTGAFYVLSHQYVN